MVGHDGVRGGPSLRGRSPAARVLLAFGVYVAWTALTWLLEGRPQTMLRPEATVDRLVYTGVANVLVGTLLALWVVRSSVADGWTTRDRLGFRSAPRTLLAVGSAGLLGTALYVAQRPATMDPVVVVNALAQVLPVSIAELVVCWVLVGGTVEAALAERGLGGPIAAGLALVVSAGLFGAYHVAHSPPFDSPELVGLLTLVGGLTGIVYFVGRTAYGALVFHAFMALFGVTAAMAEAGRLDALAAPRAPLVVTALVALAILVVVERRFIHDG